MKSKELVTLRKKPLKNGGYSLFLDYALGGVRYKEYLHMYLLPEKDKLTAFQNEETLRIAQAAKAKKVIALQDGAAGLRPRAVKDMLLTTYVQQQADAYRIRGHREYAFTLEKIKKWLEDFHRRISLQALTKEYILDFVDFMRRSGLKDSTIHVYFSNLNTILNNAYRDEYISENPIGRIDRSLKPKRPESTREYLTLEEVKQLMDTRCGNEAVKGAFLFACFTGLRLSDIEALTWGNIKQSADGWQVEERQMKTRKLVVIPLSKNALSTLPPRKKNTDKVWAGLPSRSEIGNNIRRWVKKAGIDKHITFHCSRHTNATLLITYGVDIYTVASLLGHTDPSTTKIYAKVVNEKKVRAVELIPSIGES